LPSEIVPGHDKLKSNSNSNVVGEQAHIVSPSWACTSLEDESRTVENSDIQISSDDDDDDDELVEDGMYDCRIVFVCLCVLVCLCICCIML